ncbi:hypothetical protein N7340_08355 [Comamonas aquatica]|uniref:hypothetical protein n=1 Tax=Comamonas aquatica TaxID=225991 RepID=UPI0024473084|nr:hypothetical protein [Comamonas aquatica]MDH0371782.1 hypothetical protein [Comamonas aquatica]
MTHHTDAERAEFEAWARGYGTWEVKRDDDVALGTTGYTDITLTVAWHAVQAARRAPAAPVPQGWIDPNDKAQKQYLPHIGERVLFKHDGRVYLGKHTGGSFKAEYPFGKTFGTWDCKWMYPSALDAAAPQPPEAAPVQLPEPVAKIFFDRKGCEVSELPAWENLRPYGTHELVSVQQVRQLLANHGIQEQST